jgi:hypothetical protein
MLRCLLSLPLSALLLQFTWSQEQAAMPGAELYKQHCVECHGPKGQGVAGKFDEALFGERSLDSLTKYIDKYMPEDKPELLDAAQSRQVAEWMYGDFYSPGARAKYFPPTKTPSRLTVRQYAESAADLLMTFAEPRPPALPGPLKGVYFQSDGMNKKARKHLDKDDGYLHFDFADKEPVPGLPAEQYSIAWQGSLLSQDTGWYDFRLSTPNGARLYLNADLMAADANTRDDSSAKRATPLIDEWVSSGTEVRVATARIYLLGGRPYPMRLDYFKFKDKFGSLKVELKAPHGEWAVLETPFLSPTVANYVPIAETSFPADDASVGYERGNAISKPWSEAVTKAAVVLATETSKRLERLIKTKYEAPDAIDKTRTFLTKLAERGFRRPIDDALKQIYVEANFVNNTPVEAAAKQGVLRILSSPRFLYPEFAQPEDAYTKATRLALALWDSVPDTELRHAARDGQFLAPEQHTAQANRMLNDPRAKAKLRAFFTEWLNMEEGEDLSKDGEAYPGFDAHAASDLRQSLHRFVDHVVWEGSGDYRQLLEADYLFLNERLAKIYGIPNVTGSQFQQVKCDPVQRAGILTHPFLLSAFAYHKSSSPIHRGVFVTRHVLGRTLRPPPMAIEFMDDRFDPSLTMREKVTELTNKQSCLGCHTIINPLGFSLENYDAIGRFRTMDNNKPVNPVAEYVDTAGKSITLKGPRDLATYAASSEDSRRGFVRQLFQYMVKQPPAAYGSECVAELEKRFLEQNCSIKQLMVEIALRAMKPPQPSLAKN